MNEHKSTEKYVHCPYCSAQIARSRNSDEAIRCPKCRRELGLFVNNDFLMIYEVRSTKLAAELLKRAAEYYMERQQTE